MKPYYEHAGITIYNCDCREVLPEIQGFTAVCTDPPYGLGFMGKDWDHGVPGEHFWELVLAACLPGAHLMAFGGTRTHHRLMCAIEDAGWEIRDCLMWLYGSGFPKSLDISKAVDKAAGAEREDLGPARHIHSRGAATSHPKRPGERAVEDSGRRIEQTAEGARITAPATPAAHTWNGWGTALKPAWEPICLAMKPLDGTFVQNALEHGVAGLNIDGGRVGAGGTAQQHPSGRWPANLLLDEDSAAMLDRQAGESVSTDRPRHNKNDGKGYATYGNYGDAVTRGHSDSGGPSRFFYTAKAGREDRLDSNHPTIKPLALLRYLLKLLATPTGGLVLDPFMGTGTTLAAAKAMHMQAIGIELDEAHCETAAKRLAQEVLPLD